MDNLREDEDGETWFLDSYKDERGGYMKYFPDIELNPEKKTDDWLVLHQFSSVPIKIMSYAIPCKLWVVNFSRSTTKSLTVRETSPSNK